MKRIKKDCWNCRASYTLHGAWDFRCQLGYRVEAVKIGNHLYMPTPKEVCPKPKTWKAYFDEDSLNEHKRNERT